MNALILGASAGLGRSLSEALAARGHGLLLAASDRQDLDAQARQLRLNYGIHVEFVATNASQAEDCAGSIRAAVSRFERISAIFFPIGLSYDNDNGLLSVANARQLVEVNLLSVIAIISDFLPGMLSQHEGHIVGFGSVAAIRGRKTNMIYAAAKRGLASYFESLRHLTAGSGIRVQFYQLGYIATQQTFGRRLLFPPASPRSIAETIVRDLDKTQGMRYLPRYWAIIASVVYWLPWFAFKRLDF